jgi:hypothetical protein
VPDKQTNALFTVSHRRFPFENGKYRRAIVHFDEGSPGTDEPFHVKYRQWLPGIAAYAALV